jgi:hypothetical protein
MVWPSRGASCQTGTLWEVVIMESCQCEHHHPRLVVEGHPAGFAQQECPTGVHTKQVHTKLNQPDEMIPAIAAPRPLQAMQEYCVTEYASSSSIYTDKYTSGLYHKILLCATQPLRLVFTGIVQLGLQRHQVPVLNRTCMYKQTKHDTIIYRHIHKT